MKTGVVTASFSVRVEMEQLAKLSSDQSRAFLLGCGEVIAAAKGREAEPVETAPHETPPPPA